jgi:hypothetical protein
LLLLGDLLLYLAKFYDVQGHQSWERSYERHKASAENSFGETYKGHTEDDDTDSDADAASGSDESPEKLSLEEAVLRFPSMAVDALIPIVCLQEENFHFDRFLARAAESKRQPQQPAGKRDLHVTGGMDTKRARLDPQPFPPPVESNLGLHRILASSSSSSDPTELTKIWWDKDKGSDVTTLGNAAARHAEMAARAGDLPKPQQPLLPVRGGSEPWIIPPAEFSESPTEVIERPSKSAK